MGTVRGKERLIERLYKRKFSVSSIARKLHVATTAVSQKLEQMGLRERIHPDRLSRQERVAILKAYKAGVLSGVLAKQYDVASATIREVARKGGALVFGRGNRTRVFSDVERRRIARMWPTHSQGEIATALGTIQSTISRLGATLGLPPKTRGRGAAHGSWKGGRAALPGGYIGVLVNIDDPVASMRNQAGYVPEHRLVMARSLGRPLSRRETVHHIDGDKTNNAIENLQLRHGPHGKGTHYKCADCGSRNIVAEELG